MSLFHKTGVKTIKSFNKQQEVIGLLFILPACLLLAIFLIFPFILSFVYSFQYYNILRPDFKEFIFLDNYIQIFENDDFIQAFKNTAYFAIIVVPVQTVLALMLAMLVNKKTRFTNIFRIGFYAPFITSLVVVSILWTIMYSNDGLINGLLHLVNIPPQPFLSSKDQAMNSIIVLSVWQSAGYFMMIFLAGLQDIPEELYEAAVCDGASGLQKFWYITIACLRHVIKFAVMVTAIQAFKLFQQPFIMTKGGPQGSTRTIVQIIYEEGFQYRNMGYASAITVLFFIIILAVSVFMNKIPIEKA